MLRAAGLVGLVAVAGCGGAASRGTGGLGGGSGRGGGVVVGGFGDGQSETGVGDGGAADGGVGQTGGLPPCAIQARPKDPLNGIDGGSLDPRLNDCNSIEPSGPWVTPEVFPWGDGGVPPNAGPGARAAGGVVLDGDYDLIRLQLAASSPYRTRRTIRVFGGGTYIERGVFIEDPNADGGVQKIRYDTAEAPAGSNFNSQSVCDYVITNDAYTADSDLLTLFVFFNTTDDPSPIGIDTYRRTCTR